MLKIALYGRLKDQKIIRDILTSPLMENNISFEFYDASNSPEFIKKYLFDNDFRLFIACLDNKTSYIIRSYSDANDSHLIFGSMSFPPTPDEINEELLKNHDLSGTCPHGEYIIKKSNTKLKILHEDIEYINAENGKTIIHFKSGDTETVSKRMSNVANELNRKYFVKCSNGFMVNVFNVRKIHKVSKDTSKIELVSGAEIPLAKSYTNMFFEAYSLSVPEFDRLARLKMLDE